MIEFTITTPAVLFPAISLLILAYMNKFVAITSLIRTLKERYIEDEDENILSQIRNLRRRMIIIRNMQWLAVFALFLCILSMYFIFENQHITAKNLFVAGMIALMVSLFLSLREIHLSIVAISLELKDMNHHLKEKKNILRKIEELEF
ncbi:MAG: DUF2721 domain-containing protein [Saprospiraceae bacterium]|nr:DUF2721 domain-containing protein [Saprospiraceae bacterium]